MTLFYSVIIGISFFIHCSLGSQEKKYDFHEIYPLKGFKTVVDTCMRSYSDALMLQERITNHERLDDLLDLLVGRLIRLESYVEQLIYAYKYEATVSFDELEYLMRMLEYLEITITQSHYEYIATGLNTITTRLKHDLKQALGLLSFQTIIPGPLLHCWYLPIKYPLPLFV